MIELFFVIIELMFDLMFFMIELLFDIFFMIIWLIMILPLQFLGLYAAGGDSDD